MQMRRSNYPLLITTALVMLGLSACSKQAEQAAGNGKGPGGGKKDGDKAIAVSVVSVEARDLKRSVESVGSLFAYDEVAVSSEVEGKADKVLVDVGDRVTKGQVLVEIERDELKLTADQQEALLEQARAKLGVQEGAELTDPTKSASVQKAAADLANAKQKFQRTKELAEQGLLPKQTYDQDESTYKAAQATYDLSLQDVRNLQAALKERHSMSDLAKKKLRDAQITAPFSGFVKERNVTLGQYLKVQAPVITIVNVDPMRVRLKIPEKMAAWIPVGQSVTTSVEAYPDRTFVGKISRINPTVDPQTRTFDAEALIENHQGLLKPGFFVKSTIVSSKTDHVILVPQKALTYAYGIYKVYQVKGDKLKESEVRLGDHIGDDVEVVQGISESAKIAIASGDQELKDGIRIKEVAVAENESGVVKEAKEAKDATP